VRCGEAVKGVELMLLSRGQKHREPLAKLRAEGIEEWLARAPVVTGGGREQQPSEQSRGSGSVNEEGERRRGESVLGLNTEVVQRIRRATRCTWPRLEPGAAANCGSSGKRCA
jgi:hypothetical protein